MPTSFTPYTSPFTLSLPPCFYPKNKGEFSKSPKRYRFPDKTLLIGSVPMAPSVFATGQYWPNNRNSEFSRKWHAELSGNLFDSCHVGV